MSAEEWARKKEADRLQNGPRFEASAILATASKVRTVHFVRHAEATHNEAARGERGRSVYLEQAFHDARLTDAGIRQCDELRDRVAKSDEVGRVQLVAVSPCTRAIDTALRSFGGNVPETAEWYALECLRERAGQHPCDGRRTVSQLRVEFPKIDFSFMEEDEDVYGETLGEKRETDDMITARIQLFFAWLNNRPETNVAVVTHSAFLSALFNKVVNCSSDVSRWFENCEMRTTFFTITENERFRRN